MCALLQFQAKPQRAPTHQVSSSSRHTVYCAAHVCRGYTSSAVLAVRNTKPVNMVQKWEHNPHNSSPPCITQPVVFSSLIRKASDVVILLDNLVINTVDDVILVLHFAMHCLKHEAADQQTSRCSHCTTPHHGRWPAQQACVAS